MKKLLFVFAFGATGFCASAQLKIGTNNNVGIGINIPTQKLHVEGNSFLNGNVGIGINIPTQKLHVEGNSFLNGNVGIGINIPTQKLHVVGNTYVTGFIGIGTNSVCYSKVKLQIYDGGNNIAFTPDENGQCIGAYQFGKSTARLDFWHPISKWNDVKMKSWALSSDSTLKTDIVPLGEVTDILKQIRTYSYYFKSDCIDERKKDYGVLAQELEKILPELIDTAKGNLFVNYNAFIAMLIKGFNEQQQKIDQQQREIKILQDIALGQELNLTELYELREMVNKMQEMMRICCKDAGDLPPNYRDSTNNNNQNKIKQVPVLYQNPPNPFSANTDIACDIPTAFNSAFIYIYNLQGVELMSFPIVQTGYNTVTVYASALPAGMYLYALVVDNDIVDTKRMILTK